MADIVIATCGGGAARLVLEQDDTDRTVHAIRVDSTIRCELVIEMRTGQPITIELGAGTRRRDLQPTRRFPLTIPLPWASYEFRAIT